MALWMTAPGVRTFRTTTAAPDLGPRSTGILACMVLDYFVLRSSRLGGTGQGNTGKDARQGCQARMPVRHGTGPNDVQIFSIARPDLRPRSGILASMVLRLARSCKECSVRRINVRRSNSKKTTQARMPVPRHFIRSASLSFTAAPQMS